MIEDTLALVGIAFYGLASVLSLACLARSAPCREKWILLAATAGALCLGGLLLRHGIVQRRIPAFGRFETLTLYALALTGGYLQMAVPHRVRGISALVMPFTTLVLLLALPGLHTPWSIDTATTGGWLGLHVLTAFVGYALFSLASFVALAYLVQDRQLKRKQFGPLFERLPPLETLDHLMHHQTRFAFLVLTASIAIGFYLAYRTGWGAGWIADPKIAATFMTWFVYAFLFHLRSFADRHGRKAAGVTLVGLVCVLFTFVGVHLLADSVHDFVLMGRN